MKKILYDLYWWKPVWILRIFCKKWFINNKHSNFSDTELTADQIYWLFYLLFKLRKLKLYKISDFLRNKLETIGSKFAPLWEDGNWPGGEAAKDWKNILSNDPGLRIRFLENESIISGTIYHENDLGEKIYLRIDNKTSESRYLYL